MSICATKLCVLYTRVYLRHLKMKSTGDRPKGLGMDSTWAVSIKVKLDMVVPLACCIEVLGPPRYPEWSWLISHKVESSEDQIQHLMC